MLRKTLLATLCATSLLSTMVLANPQTFDSELGTVSAETVVQGLNHPWALAFYRISKACS